MSHCIHSITSETLRKRGVSPDQVLAVSVHVRRGDFRGHLESALRGKPVSHRFFMAGMDIFRDRFDTCRQGMPGKKCRAVAFIFASDDLKWCKGHFSKLSDVYFSKFETKELDLAMLQNCDHSLMR